MVRDVLEHRLASYVWELRNTELSTSSGGVDFEAWLDRQGEGLQLQTLQELQHQWTHLPMRDVWNTMTTTSLAQVEIGFAKTSVPVQSRVGRVGGAAALKPDPSLSLKCSLAWLRAMVAYPPRASLVCFGGGRLDWLHR